MPSQVPGRPNADDFAWQAGDVLDEVRHAAQLLARWTTETPRRMHDKRLTQQMVGRPPERAAGPSHGPSRVRRGRSFRPSSGSAPHSVG